MALLPISFASDFTLRIEGRSVQVDGVGACEIQAASILDAETIDSIIFDGSSLTSGGAWLPMPKTYAAQLMGMMPTNWTWTNIAVSGTTGKDLLTRFPNRLAKLYDPTKKQAVIFDLGSNDLLVEGASVETVKARIVEFMGRCVALGIHQDRIFYRPISARLTAKTFNEENRSAINGWMLATYPRNTLDPATLPAIYGPNANRLGEGTLFSDVTHPNETGAGLEAQAFAAKIRASTWMPVTKIDSAGAWEGVKTIECRFFRGREL